MLTKPTRGSLTRVRSRSLTSAVINSPSFSCLCGFGILYLRSRLDALLVIRFNHIANFKVGEIFEDDAAFVAGRNLAHIVFAAPQRGDFAVVDTLFLAHDARLRRAGDFAISDATTGNDDVFPGLEYLLDLGMALDHLAVGRFQHTGQRGLDVVGQLINDIVVANIDAFFLRQALSRSIGFDVEANDYSIGCSGQVDIGLADVSNTLVDQAYLEIFIADFGERVFDGLG